MYRYAMNKKADEVEDEVEDYDDEVDGYKYSIEDSDYTIEDRPRGGYDVGHEGKHFGHFTEWDDAIAAIRKNMEKEGFFPNIWNISDHGNASIVTSAKNLTVPDQHQKKICIDNLKNPMKGRFLGGPDAAESEKLLREKFGLSDSEIARIKTSRIASSDDETLLDELFNSKDWKADKGTQYDGFDFNIKLPLLDIPDSVRKSLSDDAMSEIIEQTSADAINDFAATWVEGKPWVKDWGVEGRSGGHFIIKTDYSRAAVEEAIDNAMTYDGDSDDEYYADELAMCWQMLEDLGKIANALKAEKLSFVKQIDSEEFWADYI
jgi:hypothetical protein